MVRRQGQDVIVMGHAMVTLERQYAARERQGNEEVAALQVARQGEVDAAEARRIREGWAFREEIGELARKLDEQEILTRHRGRSLAKRTASLRVSNPSSSSKHFEK